MRKHPRKLRSNLLELDLKVNSIYIRVSVQYDGLVTFSLLNRYKRVANICVYMYVWCVCVCSYMRVRVSVYVHVYVHVCLCVPVFMSARESE